MFLRTVLLMFVLGALVACESAIDNREWMKINEKYTGEDFRRDVKACSKSGNLDGGCMRSRGWVDVSKNKPETSPFPEQKPQYAPPAPPRR
jgi:hypothetical protein